MSVDSCGELQVKSNRGPKQKEKNPNIFCRLCKKICEYFTGLWLQRNPDVRLT